MGCISSKKIVERDLNAYAVNDLDEPLDRRKDTSDNNLLVDSRLPLTPKEIFKLKSSWKAIHRKTVESGIELFISLFKRDPELRLFFFTYFNLPQEGTIDELRENSVLQNHAATVMNALDSIILIIDNVDQVVNTLSKVAIFHIKFADFHAHFFWKFEEPLLEAICIILDDRYSAYMADIYKKTIKYIFQIMVDAYTEAANEQHRELPQ